ncbi:MAG TPA: hypothetical protein P5077_12275 [bacterium]|nr:hypothetical protein [bacterium]
MFRLNLKYTIYRIGEALAMTSCQRITVKEIRENGDIIYQPQGKRKLFILRKQWQSYVNGPVNEFDGAVFEGWDTPFTSDTDQDRDGSPIRTMRGNACYNFVGPVEKIREWIETKQLNPKFRKEHVVAIGPDGNETVVYPDLYRSGHAVIDRILETQKKEPAPAVSNAA